MKWPKICCVLVLAAAIAALALRLPRLERRPMHTDEAVHAIKFGELLEQGTYRYDREEYHGPTLNYFTLIPAWLGSAEKLTDISEFTLRIVPVFFAVLLVLLLLLMTNGLGKTASIFAALLTALSPALVFYSRYYIQEVLLVCFTFGAIASGYRYTRSRNIAWAVLTGMFLGLMHATKETCMIAFGSMILALLLTMTIQSRNSKAPNFGAVVKTINPRHLAALIATAAFVSALFYSSFFTNGAGIGDSLRAYTAYFHRAGQNQLHIHPWYYYLKMLLYFRFASGPMWSEAIIIILAIIGLAVAITKKGLGDTDFHLLRFLAFYTVIMTVVYSAIPYKTPWCLLGFLHGMVLLAGVGASALLRLLSKGPSRVVVIILLTAATVHLAWQGYLSTYRFSFDPRNPYVYAHTTADVFTIARRIEDVARAAPNGRDTYIQVICPGSDYWPLPWYLRSFKNIGWQNKVDDALPPAPIIIVSAEAEADLAVKLYESQPPGQRDLYVQLFDAYLELRPQVELRGYLTHKLWEQVQRTRPEPTIPDDRSKQMSEPGQSVSFDSDDWDSIAGMYRFCHEAMGTTFEIFVVNQDSRLAQQAATNAFAELDKIEQEISRFVENSDVSRINKLRPNTPLLISPETFQCLELSIRMHTATAGAFDITIGHLKDKWTGEHITAIPVESQFMPGSNHSSMDYIRLDKEPCTVQLLSQGVRIDLGGIGKGYALDRMAKLLGEWKIDKALVHGGGSTVLALGAPTGRKGWPVTLSHPLDHTRTLARLYLENLALSSSSTRHSRHIIDPATMQPVQKRCTTWASSPDATTADALSTAFTVMSTPRIEKYCTDHTDVLAMIVTGDNILHFGSWDPNDSLMDD